jgi:hypothetical protein
MLVVDLMDNHGKDLRVVEVGTLVQVAHQVLVAVVAAHL